MLLLEGAKSFEWGLRFVCVCVIVCVPVWVCVCLWVLRVLEWLFAYAQFVLNAYWASEK